MVCVDIYVDAVIYIVRLGVGCCSCVVFMRGDLCGSDRKSLKGESVGEVM